ncbi:MAG: hypothetical protein WBY98_11735 [Candidatus Sulfotelmatobacter sp.]
MGFDNLARAGLIAAIPTLYALGSLQLWYVFVLALAGRSALASNHGWGILGALYADGNHPAAAARPRPRYAARSSARGIRWW